jgi:transposase
MARSFLSEPMWDRLAPLLPPERGKTGRPSTPHRTMIEAILWKHRTGAPWRDVPEEFGPWNSVFTRFNRWSKAGLWQTILEALRIEADTEWLMIDATVIRAHQHAAGALKKKGYPARDSGDPGADFQPKFI